MAQAAQQSEDRRVVGQLAIARGQEDEERQVAKRPQRLRQEGGRGFVEPVDVLEDEDHRRPLAGEGGELLGHRGIELLLGQPAVVEAVEIGPVRAARKAAVEPGQRLLPGGEGLIPLGFGCMAHEHGGTDARGGLEEGLDQHRLAEAGLARDQHHPRSAGSRLGECRQERLALGHAADQRRVRCWRQGGRRGRRQRERLGRRQGWSRWRWIGRRWSRWRRDRRCRPGLQPAPFGAERRGVAIRLAQQTQAGLELLLCLAPPAGREQEAKLHHPGVERVGVDLHEAARRAQRRLRLLDEPFDEGRQDFCLQPSRVLALGHAPGLKIVQVGEILALEQLAPKALRQLLQPLGRDGLDPAGEGSPHGDHVDQGVGGIEADGVPVRLDPRPVRLVDQRAKAAQAPAQGAVRVVRDLPKQRAEPLAAMRPAGQGQIGEKRARLLGRRQWLHAAVALDLDLAQEPDRQHWRLRPTGPAPTVA